MIKPRRIWLLVVTLSLFAPRVVFADDPSAVAPPEKPIVNQGPPAHAKRPTAGSVKPRKRDQGAAFDATAVVLMEGQNDNSKDLNQQMQAAKARSASKLPKASVMANVGALQTPSQQTYDVCRSKSDCTPGYVCKARKCVLGH